MRRPDPIGLPIRLQLYTVRGRAAKDFEGTLKEIAAIGYQEVELYSFFDRKAAKVRRALEDAGAEVRQRPLRRRALQEDLAAHIDDARGLGLQFMICPFPGVADPARLKASGPSFTDP